MSALFLYNYGCGWGCHGSVPVNLLACIDRYMYRYKIGKDHTMNRTVSVLMSGFYVSVNKVSKYMEEIVH